MKTTPTQKILTRPIAEWPQALNSTRASLQDIEAELSAFIQRATLLHGYIAHRFNTGCGDQGHEDGAKAARRELIGVRKALGFSYPKNTPLSL